MSAQLDRTLAKRDTFTGTPYWMAPEVIQQNAYDGKADIWSLGVTSIELAECVPPHSHVHPMRALFQIPMLPPPTLENKTMWSADFHAFLARALTKKPEDRPSAKELLSHPFVTKVPAGAREIVQDMVKRANTIVEERGFRFEEEEEEEEEDEEEEQTGAGGNTNYGVNPNYKATDDTMMIISGSGQNKATGTLAPKVNAPPPKGPAPAPASSSSPNTPPPGKSHSPTPSSGEKRQPPPPPGRSPPAPPQITSPSPAAPPAAVVTGRSRKLSVKAPPMPTGTWNSDADLASGTMLIKDGGTLPTDPTSPLFAIKMTAAAAAAASASAPTPTSPRSDTRRSTQFDAIGSQRSGSKGEKINEKADTTKKVGEDKHQRKDSKDSKDGSNKKGSSSDLSKNGKETTKDKKGKSKDGKEAKDTASSSSSSSSSSGLPTKASTPSGAGGVLASIFGGGSSSSSSSSTTKGQKTSKRTTRGSVRGSLRGRKWAPGASAVPVIRFTIRCPTEFGESIVLIGSSPELGNWQYGRPMTFTPTDNPGDENGGGFWEAEVPFDAGTKSFSYKYFKLLTTLDAVWEFGPNREVANVGWNAPGALELRDSWQDGPEVFDVLRPSKPSLSGIKIDYDRGITVVFKLQVNGVVTANTKFKVVGSIAELGAWQPKGAKELTLTSDRWYSASLVVPDTKGFEFKYVREEAGHTKWEQGSNRLFHSSSETSNQMISVVISTDYFRN